jgi:hypothetical protein
MRTAAARGSQAARSRRAVSGSRSGRRPAGLRGRAPVPLGGETESAVAGSGKRVGDGPFAAPHLLCRPGYGSLPGPSGGSPKEPAGGPSARSSGRRGRRPSAERRAPSAERRAPITEHRAPSAERRAPSAEHRAPSTERRAPSAERRAPRREPGAIEPRAPRHKPRGWGGDVGEFSTCPRWPARAAANQPDHVARSAGRGLGAAQRGSSGRSPGNPGREDRVSVGRIGGASRRRALRRYSPPHPARLRLPGPSRGSPKERAK